MSKDESRKTAKSKRTSFCVVPQSSAWALWEEGRARASRVYKTQREAVEAARKLITARNGGDIVVRGRNGRIRGVDTYVLGGDGFDKISAVEGIFLSAEMKRDFRALDGKRLSPEKRREWLIAKYGSRSDDIRRRK
jgi:hypothetical protein